MLSCNSVFNINFYYIQHPSTDEEGVLSNQNASELLFGFLSGIINFFSTNYKHVAPSFFHTVLKNENLNRGSGHSFLYKNNFFFPVSFYFLNVNFCFFAVSLYFLKVKKKSTGVLILPHFMQNVWVGIHFTLQTFFILVCKCSL